MPTNSIVSLLRYLDRKDLELFRRTAAKESPWLDPVLPRLTRAAPREAVARQPQQARDAHPQDGLVRARDGETFDGPEEFVVEKDPRALKVLALAR